METSAHALIHPVMIRFDPHRWFTHWKCFLLRSEDLCGKRHWKNTKRAEGAAVSISGLTYGSLSDCGEFFH